MTGPIKFWSADICSMKLNIKLNASNRYKTNKLRGRRRMVSSGMLHRVALVRTDVSEEPSASFIRVTRNTTWYFFAACVGC
jgi:hypothetical protein